MVNAANAERREFLINFIIKHRATPAHIVRAAVSEEPDEHMLRAYEYICFTTDDHISFEKVFYLLGGNDPAKCPYGNKVNSHKEHVALKGDMAQQFNESQEQPDVFDDQDPDGL
jgi:hypothetical protein